MSDPFSPPGAILRARIEDLAVGGLTQSAPEVKQWFLERILEEMGVSVSGFRLEAERADLEVGPSQAPVSFSRPGA